MPYKFYYIIIWYFRSGGDSVSTGLMITLAIGIIGGILFYKMKIPAGVLVGSIVAVTILSVTTEVAVMPAKAKLLAQIITGAYIGSGIKKKDLMHLPYIIKPYATMMVIFLALNLTMGFIIHAISPMDLVTSMLCALPGGVSDTPLIAMDMGADVPKVAVVQFSRMLFGIAVMPIILSAVNKKIEKKLCVQTASSASSPTAEPSVKKDQPAKNPAPKRGAVPLIITLSVGAAAGILGDILPVTAGPLLFSMLAVTALKMFYEKSYLPLWFRRVAQVLSGCVIGCRIKHDDIMELRFVIIPAVVLLSAYVINCILTGHLLHKLYGIQRLEAMLSVSPAGATEMALIAADLGINSPDLIVLQVCRLMGVMAIFPQIISLVLSLAV